MKTLLLFIVPLLIVSCSKQMPVVQKPLADHYYFKIKSIDLDDSTVSQTPVFVLNPVQVTKQTESGVDDCSKHPNSAQCRTMPVFFVNVSVVQKGDSAIVTWRADLEINVKNYFILERNYRLIDKGR